MIICYVIYCIVLHFNTPLEKWAYSLKLPIKLPTKEEQSALVTFKNLPDPTYTQSAEVEPQTELAVQSPHEQNYQGYNEANE